MTSDEVPITPEQEKLIKDTVMGYKSIAGDVAKSLHTLRFTWSADQVRAMREALDSISVQVAKQAAISIKPLMDQARALAEFQQALPKVVIDFPKLANAFASSSALEHVRATIEQTVQIPPITLRSETLRTLRLEAEVSVASIDTPDAEPLEELLMDLENVEDAATQDDITPAGLSAEGRVGLTLGIIAIVLEFLANQEVILRNAFKDAALAGAGLSRVWQYFAALVAALLVYEKIRPNG